GQRALEIGCKEVLMAKNGVDGVYDSAPRPNPEARKLEHVTYSDALQQGLKVVDSTAFSLCIDNAHQMLVFELGRHGNITRALRGERSGTVVAKWPRPGPRPTCRASEHHQPARRP